MNSLQLITAICAGHSPCIFIFLRRYAASRLKMERVSGTLQIITNISIHISSQHNSKISFQYILNCTGFQ